jgi:dipeptidyl-peptidase 4
MRGGAIMPLGFAIVAGLSASGGPGPGTAPVPSAGEPNAGRLSFERVARFPPPGARVATGFKFTHDGRFLYYLALEGAGAERSLVREEVRNGRREIVARAFGEAGQALTREEILRRERRRIQDLGITQFVLAERADRVVYAWAGDLYLVRPGSTPIRLTSSGATEIDPRLSPDGRRLAFVRDGDLHVMDLDTRSERRLTSEAADGITAGLAEYIAQEEMDRSEGFWWAPDGERLAFARVDETGIPSYPIVHQGRESIEVETHRYPFAGGPNARVRLGVVAATGGPATWLDPGPEPEHDGYLARAEFGPDGSFYVQVQSRDQSVLRLLRFAPGSEKADLVLEERAQTWIRPNDDFRPLEDGRFLWSSEAGGFRHVEVRAADGRLVRDLTPGDAPVDKVEGIDARRGIVYFTAARDGALHRPLYSVPLGGGAITRLTPEPGFHTVTVAPEGGHIVDVHDSAATPPRARLLDGDGRQVRTIDANDDPEVAALGLRPPELVTLPGPDGTTLHAALFLPRDLSPGRRYPALVRVYGGPTVQTVKDSWELTQDLRAQNLAERGYVVFRLDNRGSPRRGRAFETAAYRRLGSVEVEDQIAGARWLAARPYVDGERIGIYGWSYGGYMAALSVLRAPEIFKAAVIGAPVTDWDGYDTHYTERYMGTPADNPDGYRTSSVLPLASTLARPVLLIHGMADENVHFRHTARLINALNTARRPYDLLVFPDERHLPRSPADRAYLEQRLAEHFDRHLGPR